MNDQEYQIKRAALDQEFMEQKCSDEYYLRESASLEARKTEKTMEFIEEVYEIAFGDNAINREFTTQDVLDQLRKFSDDSCEKYENVDPLINELDYYK